MVAYRETITQAARAEGKFIRQSGGKGQYGHVLLEVEPLRAGEKFQFVDAIKGGTIPREYIPAVEKGIREAMETGVLAGYPMVDIKVTLVDGSYHEVDSSEMAFKIAGSMGFKEGARRAQPILLEPVMAVEVIVSGGVYRRGQRRPGFPARKDPESGGPERSAGDRGQGASGRDVRLCHPAALEHPGPGDLYHAIFPL